MKPGTQRSPPAECLQYLYRCVFLFLLGQKGEEMKRCIHRLKAASGPRRRSDTELRVNIIRIKVVVSETSRDKRVPDG